MVMPKDTNADEPRPAGMLEWLDVCDQFAAPLMFEPDETQLLALIPVMEGIAFRLRDLIATKYVGKVISPETIALIKGDMAAYCRESRVEVDRVLAAAGLPPINHPTGE